MGTELGYWECVRKYPRMDQQLSDIIESDDKDKFVDVMTEQLIKPKIYDYLETTNGCVELVNLFLHHNAQTDLRCKCEEEMYHDMLPLNLGLETIRTSKYLEGWTPKQSILKMLINLCLPGLRSRLEVVKLLCSSSKQIEMEIYYCAKTGKLVELAVLLIVAREKVMSPSFFDRLFTSQNDPRLNGSITLHHFIITELTLLAALEAKQMYRRDRYDIACMSKENKALKISTLFLLEVFERAGDDIEAYLQLEQAAVPEKQVAEEVACLLQKAGFSLNYEDIDLSHTERCLPLEFDWRDATLGHLLAEKSETPQLYRSLLEDLEMSNVLPDKEKELNQSANRKKQINALEPYAKWRMDSAQYLDEYLNFVLQSFNKIDDARSKLDCDDRLKLHYLGSLYQALDSLCDHQFVKDWSPEKSIFKLLYIICSPELRKLVDKIRLLACNIEEIGEITCLYAKKGKLVEFATLLMVAREKLLPIVTSHESGVIFNGSMMICQCIMSEIQSLVDEKTLLIYYSQACLADILEGKKMLLALQLVELFEKAGADIDRYCQVARNKGLRKEQLATELGCVLDFMGFHLNLDDLSFDKIKSVPISPLGEKETEELNRHLEEVIGVNFDLLLQKPRRAMENRGAGTYWCNISTKSSQASLSPCFTSRPFSTFQTSRFYSPLDSSLVMRNRATKRFVTSRSYMSFNQKCSYLALAIKRGIKLM